MPEKLLTTDKALAHFGGYLSQVYAWMTGGLFLTALVSWYIYTQIVTLTSVGVWIISNDWLIFVLFMAEYLVVIFLTMGLTKMSTLTAISMFLVYAVMNGVFFGILITAFTLGSVFGAFLATSGTFLVMSVYGYFTKSDLTGFGNLAIMGLIGVIIGTIVNAVFIGSEPLNWLLTYIGLGIFIVLVASETQRIKGFAVAAESQGNYAKYAIIGALSLYLSFINIFIRLLAIMGKRR